MQIIEKKVYEEGRSDRYRDRDTRGRATAGLTLGIIGTALGVASLWNRNGGGGIGSLLTGGAGGGGSLPANVNINATGGNGAGGGGCYAPTPFEVYSKECNDNVDLIKGMYDLYIASTGAATKAREVDIAEKFGLYKTMIDADFGLYKDNRDNIDAVNNRINSELFSLYKYTRDKDDETKKELCDLKAQVAINSAVRPYQDKLIQCEMEKLYTAAINYVDRKCCRMIEGYVAVPNDTITGFVGANCCFPRTTTAAGGGTTPTT